MAKHMKSSQRTPTQSGQSSPTQSQSEPGQGASQQKDAEALLKADHRKVEGLFRQFEGAGENSRKQELVKQICNELIIHSKIEEDIFYPACRARDVEDDALDEAQVEHDALKFLIGDLLGQSAGSPFYDAKLTVLKEYVKHHVEEEEKAGSGIFAKARKADVDMDALGLRLQELKERLAQQAESGALEPPRPRALTQRMGGFNQQRQESDMSRWNEMERDDRGRYMDEDDHRAGGRFGGGDYQGRYARSEREYRGRGSMRGGSQGHGSQRGGEQGSGGYGGRGYGRGGYSEYGGAGGGGSGGNRDYGGGGGYATGYGGGYGTGSGGGYDSDWDMDRGGAYGSSGGYGRSGGPGGYRGMGGYGGSGEFGGSRGGRGFGGPERDEQGRFMSDDDNGGMRGSRGGQRGGSRGGFERERDDYGRFMSEDEGNGNGGRGGSRGGYRGGRGGNDDNRGWFGDSRGHAEAARRGWQNRDD